MLKKNQIALNKILREIEDNLWDDEFSHPGIPLKYDKKSIGSASKIFSSVLINKMWEKFEKDETDIETRLSLVESAGKEIRLMVMDFTGINLHKLYGEK